MASTKSGLEPGLRSKRMTRSVYETALDSKIACLPVAFTRSTERGSTALIKSSWPASSALTRADSSVMARNSISSR